VDDEETRFFDAISDHSSEPAPEPDPDPDPSPDPDPGVGVNVGDDSSPNSGVYDSKPAGLDNSFNPDGYWGINRIQAIRVFERYANIFSLAKQRVNFLQKELERRNICTYFGETKRDLQPVKSTHLLSQSSIEPRAIHLGY
jgi:hypothetical protein